MVVLPEEGPDVVEARPAQVGRPADGGPVVRVIGCVQGLEQRHRRQAVRAVLVGLAPLVQHDVALVVELRLRQSRQEKSHPVRFHPERQLEGSGRHQFPIVRPVGVGRTIERGAGLLQREEEIAVVVLGPLEHQMFEQVGEPGAPRPLVLRADVIPEVHGDNRTAVVFVDQQRQSVGEHMSGESQFHDATLRLLSVCRACPFLATIGPPPTRPEPGRCSPSSPRANCWA